jgi:cytochrome c
MAGATAGAVPGYRYGKSLVKAGAEQGLIWTEETFSAYVQNPKDFLKEFLDDKKARAKMSFKVRKEEDARNIYAYLYSIGSR